MNNISIEELEGKIEVGEEVVDRYFDSTTTRVGTPRQMTSRREQDIVQQGSVKGFDHFPGGNECLNYLNKLANKRI